MNLTTPQKIRNLKTHKKYDFYTYGQIIRNKIPEDLTDFYINHEGFVSSLDEELIIAPLTAEKLEFFLLVDRSS